MGPKYNILLWASSESDLGKQLPYKHTNTTPKRAKKFIDDNGDVIKNEMHLIYDI